jgi:1,4-dihydroxy-2-naphthoate octaprenyltransferase
MTSAASAAETRTGWWRALNPAIYLVSILPGLGVWQLSNPASGASQALLLATLAVVLLQHSINVLNDVSDWRLGADEEKWDSWVRAHHGNLSIASLHGWLSFLCGGLLGLGVLIQTNKLWILLIALPMVGLGYLYNSGKRPLSYTHLGEWVTGLCYGPGVVGCLWLLTGSPIDLTSQLAMIGFGALAVALLFSHQPPQIDTDRQAGKHSFAVRFGAEKTYFATRLLLLAFLVTYGLSLAAHSSALLITMYSIAAALATIFTLRRQPNPKTILLLASGVVALSLVVA